jgi:hypothetical protein
MAILEMLAFIRKRPGMYIGEPTPATIGLFMHGFLTGCMACGLKASWRDFDDVAGRHGWSQSNLLKAMHDKGLSEQEIVDGVIALYEQVISEALARAQLPTNSL